MSRVVHNPAALLDAEIESVRLELRLLREKNISHRTDRWKYVSARLDGLTYARAVYRDSCTPLPDCPHDRELMSATE